MRWGSERYAKLYTRDTAEWLSVSWQARGLFYELLRKADRSGRITLGKLSPSKALAVLIRASPAELETPIAELLEDGCVVHKPGFLILRNYVEAQETPQTPAARKRNERESFDLSRTVTPPHELSPLDQTRLDQTKPEPAAAPAPARLPSASVHMELEAPLLAALLRRLDFGVTVPRKATTWGATSAHVESIGLDAAVAACEAAAPRSDGYPDRVPLGFLERILSDAAKRPAAPPKPKLPEPDPAWLASLGPRRAAAEKRWAETVAGMSHSAYPNELPRLLSERLPSFMAEFDHVLATEAA